MKIFILFLLSCTGGILGCTFGLSVDSTVFSTLYNAMCIVFSVGMGLIVTFSLDGIKNINYIRDIRNNIKQVRGKFIILFTLCTIFFILEKYWPNIDIQNMNLQKLAQITTVIFFALSIGYFIHNFIRIQQLKNDIFDRLLRENEHR